jgi:outer membrane protein OmpA-like peptidoglycan-associated protein
LPECRKEGFNDAWIFKGFLGGINQAGRAESETMVVSTNETLTVEVVPAVIENTVIEKPVTPPASDPKEETVSVATPPDNVRPIGKPFVFKLLNGETGSPVTGQVHLLESEKSNQYRGFNGNEKVYVVPPGNRGGKWYVVCNVIGFQPYKKSFSYNDPIVAGAALGNDEEFVMPLELRRVRKGDYIEMDQVKFFENSNILTPQSERELSELVAMMEENQGYKIKLHGHTNGNQGRNIISREENQNFFGLEPDNKRFEGTAKLLSELRAETIRNYLVSKGIDGERITVRGEGGKQPIFDPKGTAAANNARVEVEITKH